jgi:hypothetical protein
VQRSGPLYCRLPTIKEQRKGGEEVQGEEQGLNKKYQGHARVGQKWESSHEDFDNEGMATLAIPTSSRSSSTTSPMMKIILLFASWKEELRYKNHPPFLPNLPLHLVVDKMILKMRKNNIEFIR